MSGAGGFTSSSLSLPEEALSIKEDVQESRANMSVLQLIKNALLENNLSIVPSISSKKQSIAVERDNCIETLLENASRTIGSFSRAELEPTLIEVFSCRDVIFDKQLRHEQNYFDCVLRYMDALKKLNGSRYFNGPSKPNFTYHSSLKSHKSHSKTISGDLQLEYLISKLNLGISLLNYGIKADWRLPNERHKCGYNLRVSIGIFTDLLEEFPCATLCNTNSVIEMDGLFLNYLINMSYSILYVLSIMEKIENRKSLEIVSVALQSACNYASKASEFATGTSFEREPFNKEFYNLKCFILSFTHLVNACVDIKAKEDQGVIVSELKLSKEYYSKGPNIALKDKILELCEYNSQLNLEHHQFSTFDYVDPIRNIYTPIPKILFIDYQQRNNRPFNLDKLLIGEKESIFSFLRENISKKLEDVESAVKSQTKECRDLIERRNHKCLIGEVYKPKKQRSEMLKFIKNYYIDMKNGSGKSPDKLKHDINKMKTSMGDLISYLIALNVQVKEMNKSHSSNFLNESKKRFEKFKSDCRELYSLIEKYEHFHDRLTKFNDLFEFTEYINSKKNINELSHELDSSKDALRDLNALLEDIEDFAVSKYAYNCIFANNETPFEIVTKIRSELHTLTQNFQIHFENVEKIVRYGEKKELSNGEIKIIYYDKLTNWYFALYYLREYDTVNFKKIKHLYRTITQAITREIENLHATYRIQSKIDAVMANNSHSQNSKKKIHRNSTYDKLITYSDCSPSDSNYYNPDTNHLSQGMYSLGIDECKKNKINDKNNKLASKKYSDGRKSS